MRRDRGAPPLDITAWLQTLQEIAEALAAARDLQAIVDAVGHHLTTRLGYLAVGVLTRTPDRAAFSLAGVYPQDLLQRVLGPDLLATLSEARFPFHPDPPPDPSAPPSDRLRALPLSHFLPHPLISQILQAFDHHFGQKVITTVIPAVSGGETVAALALATRAPEVPPEELEVLLTIGRQMGIALENFRLVAQAHRRLEELVTLRAIGLQMSEPQPLQSLLQHVVEEAARLLGTESGGLYLYDEEAAELELVVSHNLGRDRRGLRMKVGEGLAGKAVETGQAITVADYHTWPGRSPQWAETETKANLAVPLTWKGQVLGALYISSRAEREPFSEDDVRLLILFAQQAAVAVHNARLVESLRQEKTFSEGLIDTASALIVVLDREGRITLFNRACEELTGYRREEVLGTNWFERFIPPRLRPDVGGVFEQLVGGESPNFYENPILTRAGEERTVAWSNTVTWDEQGQVQQVLAIGQDVTVQRQSERQILQRSMELSLLVEAGQEFGRELGWEPTLRRVAQRVREHLNADSCTLYLLEPDRETLRPAVTVGPNAEQLMDFSLKVGQGITGDVAQTGVPELVNHAERDPRAVQVPGTEVEPESLICVPLVARGETFGVLTVSRLGGREFAPEDLRLVTGLAHLAASAIQNARLYQQTRQRVEQLGALHETLLDIGREVDLETLLETIVKRACLLLGGEGGGLYLYDPAEGVARCMVSYRTLRDYRGIVLRPGEGVAGRVIATGQPLLIEDYRTWEGRADVFEEDQPFRAVISAPLRWQEEIAGVIHVLGYQRTFTHEDLWLLEQFAAQAALAYGKTLLLKASRQAELTALQEAARRAHLMESMAEGLIVLDTSWRIVEVNRALCQMTGFGREEFVGKSPPFPHWPPGRAGEYLATVQQLLKELTPLGPLELTFQRKDGSTFPALVSISPVRDEAWEVTGFIAVLLDLTERQMLEDQLRQAQKMEAIGTLAGGIAHDFNNILVGILGYASLLQSELPESSPLQKDVSTIIKSARRAADLTQQLLSFARRTRRQVAPVDLNDLVQEVVTLLQQTVDRRIEIVTQLAPGLPAVEGDGSQLQQVILNLSLNACEAMPTGGRLTLRSHAVQFSEAHTAGDFSLRPGQYVVLEVTDTGAGMDQSVQRHIFEPFFTTKEHGRGLGLATSYGIVRAHEGVIRVQSAPGKGSTFSVFLPSIGTRVQRTLPVLEARPVGGTETLLVVDDEEMVRDMLARALQAEGYRVLTAEDGQQGVEVFAQCKDEIDLVVLDLMMPHLNGAEALRHLREIEPAVRVLISSGYSPEGEGQHLLDAGAEGFLQKPYDVDQVLLTVRQVLDRR